MNDTSREAIGPIEACYAAGPIRETCVHSRLAFLLALLLVAANLRAALTGVGPVLDAVQAELKLSPTAAGTLVSLPVLMFAVFAPLAGLARRFGAGRLLLAGLALLATGLIVRSIGGTTALFGGTVLLGIGIASTNVLLPVVIKRRYPDRVTSMTTAYATVMGASAALASGVSVPLAEVLPGGWRGALAIWAVPACIALLAWLPHSPPPPGRNRDMPASTPRIAAPAVWRTSVAWQITGFMGLQSTVFYIVINWFPAYLRESGFSAAAAGWLMTLYQVAALVAGMAVPMLVSRLRDQRALALGLALLTLSGILGVLYAPGFSTAWFIVMGAGSGPSLVLALSFMGLRARDSASAATLSLLSQGVGYFVAACGPVWFGLVREHTGGWNSAILATAAVALLYGLCGFGAGRAIKV